MSCHLHCGPGCGLETALPAPTQGLTLDLPALAESLSALSLHEVLGIEVEFLQGCQLPDVLQRSSADVPPAREEKAPQVRLCTGCYTAQAALADSLSVLSLHNMLGIKVNFL